MPNQPNKATGTKAAQRLIVTEQPLKNLEALLRLAPRPRRRRRGPQPLEPQSFPACSPPDVRIPPQFVVSYRRPLLINQIPVTIGDDIDLPILRLACVKVNALELWFGFDLKFDQTWNLVRLGIGDLSSTIGLAPLERLTLEFQTSQRRVLEKTSVESAEEMTSFESTTADKEAVNVARSSSRTENWHVDGSGSFGIGSFKLSAGADVSGSTVETSNRSIQHVTEATTKSSHSLRTLHKIEVRGVTETLIQNRMTRVIKNPYPDRTLSINVFQLIKHFSVETNLAEIRLALIIPIISLVFDNEFVVSNGDFLRDNLLDQSLVDELPVALKGAKQIPLSSALDDARTVAKLALHYLYDEPNIFNLPDILAQIGFGQVDLGNPNDPATSLNASLPIPLVPGGQVPFGNTGFSDALTLDFGLMFTTLNLFFKVYRDMIATNTLDANAISLATALAADVGPKLTAVTDAGNVRGILDDAQFTEIFRRLSGFLAMISGMLNPLVAAADPKEQEEAVSALDRLKRHLGCHKNYYIQKFLVYVARQTDNQDIVDFVNRVIARAFTGPLLTQVNRTYDVERSFVDRQQIIVPSFDPISPAVFGEGRITPTVIEVDVPSDGIHLEAAEGACILANVPPQAGYFKS